MTIFFLKTEILTDRQTDRQTRLGIDASSRSIKMYLFECFETQRQTNIAIKKEKVKMRQFVILLAHPKTRLKWNQVW